MRRRRSRTIRTPHGDGLAGEGVAAHRGHRCLGQGRHRRERAGPVRAAHLAGSDAPPGDPHHHDPSSRRAPGGPSRIVAPRARGRPAAWRACRLVSSPRDRGPARSRPRDGVARQRRGRRRRVGGRRRSLRARLHERAPRRVLRDLRTTCRAGAARVALGQPGLGVLSTSAATASPRTSWCCPTACTSAT